MASITEAYIILIAIIICIIIIATLNIKYLIRSMYGWDSFPILDVTTKGESYRIKEGRMACIAFRESDVLNMCQHKSGQDIIVPEEYIPRDEKAKLDDGIILMNNAVLIHISSMLKELVWIGTVTFKTGDEYRSRHLKVTLPTKSVLILEPIDKERAAYGYNR